MTDFETHPVGTAARIAELEAALTRANAATAAAYEAAARVITDRKSEMADVSKTLVGTEKIIFAEIVSLLDIVASAIRALTTPDQTAALDKLIAEAEGGATIVAHESYQPYATEYVRADLAAVQPAQVRVKPLVWEEPRDANNWINVARSVFGDYYISIDGGRHGAWLEANVKPYENKIGDDVGSVIEAMMLADTDYQARMQPLIDQQPDPRDEVVKMMPEVIAALRSDGLNVSLVSDLVAALAAAEVVQHG